MQKVRLATEEEISKISDTSDINPNCTIFALDTHKGTGFAVRRITQEIDPLVVPESWDTKLRALFCRDLEHILWAQGVPSYYFNVHCTDEDWIKVIETWGAYRTSTEPEFRYKRKLI